MYGTLMDTKLRAAGLKPDDLLVKICNGLALNIWNDLAHRRLLREDAVPDDDDKRQIVVDWTYLIYVQILPDMHSRLRPPIGGAVDIIHPLCPGCRGNLKRVIQAEPQFLNPEQYDAIKAGDWYCDKCPASVGTSEKQPSTSAYAYFWDKDIS